MGTVAWKTVDPGLADGTGRRRSHVRSVDEEYIWFFSGEYPAVVRMLFFIVHSRERAEDIAQDAFMQLLIHWKKVSAYQRPDAWVRRVAIRLAMRSIRREQMRSHIEWGSQHAELPQPIDLDLADAIQQLPPRQRSAVVLFYLEDRPMQEIADILGCSTSTGWVHLHKARRKLAALLGEEVSEGVDRPPPP
jgi:RNA polymerase sigma-70 factor (ECF subfamily)